MLKNQTVTVHVERGQPVAIVGVVVRPELRLRQGKAKSITFQGCGTDRQAEEIASEIGAKCCAGCGQGKCGEIFSYKPVANEPASPFIAFIDPAVRLRSCRVGRFFFPHGGTIRAREVWQNGQKIRG